MTMNSPTGLTFEAGPHIYKFQGNPVPSVTGILDPYSGLEFVDAEVLRVTAEFGNHVHSACHLHDTGALNRIGLSPAIEAHLTAWERFLADTGAVVLYSGTRVYSSKLGYAGTLDKIVRWGESNRIIDIKTGSVLPKTVGPQTSGYAHAWREMTSERLMQRYCVHLEPDKYTLHRLNDPKDFDIFKAALTLHRWSH